MRESLIKRADIVLKANRKLFSFYDKKLEIAPLKAKPKIDLRYAVFDVETDVSTDVHKFKLAVVYSNIDKSYKTFYDKSALTDYLFSGQFKTVWGHNVIYDLRAGIDTQRVNLFIKSLRPLIVYANDKIVVKDTFAFYPFPLKYLGQLINLQKVEISDFKVVDSETLLKRCQVDVQITNEVVKSIISLPYYSDNIVSIPQLSFETWRATLKCPIERINTRLIIDGYYGGRVEIFKRGKMNVKVIDINSSYPYAMTKLLPARFYKALTEPSKAEIEKYAKDGYLFALDAGVNIPDNIYPYSYYAPFPYRDKKLIFPIGKFRTVVLSPEYVPELINYIYRAEIYEADYIAREFVSKYYALRMNAKNEFEKMYYKLILNSVYGKFGEKRSVSDCIIAPELKDFIGITDVVDSEGNICAGYVLNGVVSISRKIDNRPYSVAVGAFITSYARKRLYDYLVKYQGVYCDTDSVFVPADVMIDPNDISQSELGKFKIEYEGEVELYAPKVYIKQNSLKAKGLPKDFQYAVVENEIVGHGVKFSQFRESVRYGIVDVYNKYLEKRISLLDNKRLWVNETDSKPIKFYA